MQELKTYFTYDWFRDIWLPAAGAILIPVAIAFFTWWFGASRAEKQKEMQELRDNLNFLVSVSLASINGLKFLHEKLHEVETKERDAMETIKNKFADTDSINSDDVCFGFVYDNVFKTIDEAKYTLCIRYNKDIVVDIVRIKSLLSSTEQYVNHRNSAVKSISECENLTIKGQRILSFISSDHEQIESFIADVCRITILLKMLIGNIVKLNQDIKGLNIELQLRTDEQMKFIEIAEEEYTEYTKQHKEQKHD